MKYPKEIAQNTLRTTRENLGLTQGYVAARLGCAVSRIDSWEKGTSTPRIRNLLRICLLYKANAEDVYPALYQALKKKVEARKELLAKMKKQKK